MTVRLSLFQLRIPFRMTFRHAAASRSETQSLWVEARDENGIIGYGESCPREYVTGESITSAGKFFEMHKADIAAQVHDPASLGAWLTMRGEAVDRDPAAWCAVELALLDLFSKRQRMSVERYLGLPELSGDFPYTAVLGDSDQSVFEKQVTKYRAVGFRDFKIKVSGKLESDQAKLAALAQAGAKRIRLDANNLWKDAAHAIAYLNRLRGQFFAVEEPIRAGDYEGMRQIAAAVGAKIILDESFTRVEQIGQIAADPNPWIVNVRVSKVGGLLRALEIVKRAREVNLSIVVGAQVGETSLLTRAALTVAASCGALLVAQEGAFGTHLLEADVCQPPLMFGAAGVLSWQPTGSGGWGLSLAPPVDSLLDIEQ